MKLSNRELFNTLILIERVRQNKKFPNEERQNSVSLEKWGIILGEEFGEFLKEINDHDDLKAIIELTETASVCLRIAEIYFSNDLLEEARKIMFDRTIKQKPAHGHE